MFKYENESACKRQETKETSGHKKLEYTRASNVNVSNFVSVKLSGHSNYEIWNSQMVCLMESQNMGGIVKHRYDSPAAKSSKIIKLYNNLLKGWILGSLDEKVAKEFVYDSGVSAKDLWRNLKYSYGQRERSAGVSSPEYEEEIETTATITEHNENAKLMVWNAQMVCLMESQNMGGIVKHIYDSPAAKSSKIIKQYNNLLKEYEEENETTATITEHNENAKLMREKLLYIPDHESHVPLVSAYSNMQFKTFAYLLEAIATADRYLSINKDSFHMLITGLIYRKQYDLAWKLDNMYDNYAIPTYEVLMAITRNFPTEISFWEALIYPYTCIQGLRTHYGR
nr:hypothetical protein [Tanacetum cinerariifolium]